MSVPLTLNMVRDELAQMLGLQTYAVALRLQPYIDDAVQAALDECYAPLPPDGFRPSWARQKVSLFYAGESTRTLTVSMVGSRQGTLAPALATGAGIGSLLILGHRAYEVASSDASGDVMFNSGLAEVGAHPARLYQRSMPLPAYARRVLASPVTDTGRTLEPLPDAVDPWVSPWPVGEPTHYRVEEARPEGAHGGFLPGGAVAVWPLPKEPFGLTVRIDIAAPVMTSGAATFPLPVGLDRMVFLPLVRERMVGHKRYAGENPQAVMAAAERARAILRTASPKQTEHNRPMTLAPGW